MKDYYRVLNISPSASAEIIKKAFRKLALQFHPDKIPGNASTAEKFSEILEAYTILSDKRKRAEYNYQRYIQNPFLTTLPKACSPEEILEQSSRLSFQISLMDPFRIDHDQIFFSLCDLLTNHNIEILKKTDLLPVRQQMVQQIISGMQHLPFDLAKIIVQKLTPLTHNDPLFQKEMNLFLRRSKQQYIWEKYKAYIALAITLLLCLIIYRAAG